MAAGNLGDQWTRALAFGVGGQNQEGDVPVLIDKVDDSLRRLALADIKDRRLTAQPFDDLCRLQ